MATFIDQLRRNLFQYYYVIELNLYNMRLFYVFLVHIRMILLGSVLFWNGSYVYCIYNGTPCMILKCFKICHLMFYMRTLHKYEKL